MKSKGAAFMALEEALNTEEVEDDTALFESGSLIRELKKSVARGDDEITLILAKAFCEKHMAVSQATPSETCIIYCRAALAAVEATNQHGEAGTTDQDGVKE